MVRDWQAKKLYDAEDEAFKRLKREGQLVEPTIDEARLMLESVCKIEKVKAPKLHELPKQCRFTADYSIIPCQVRVKPERLMDVVIIHELAHHMTPFVFPAHGAEFAATYLRLLKRHCGDHVHDVVKSAFDRYGVHYKPEHRLARVRRVAVNFANKTDKPRVCTIYDGPPGFHYGTIVSADAKTLVLDEDRKIPMDRVRYIERAPT